jgi:hypothetical protein
MPRHFLNWDVAGNPLPYSACPPLPASTLTSTTMAPRSTRPRNRSNAQATRKRAESDPNAPPKKRKTRHSKPDSDDMDIDQIEGGTVEANRGEGKSGRRAKKAGRYVPSFFLFCFFLSFSFFFFLFLSLFLFFSFADYVRLQEDHYC